MSELHKHYEVFEHDGRFIVGKEGDLIVKCPVFETHQFARAHAKFCNRTDKILEECNQQLSGYGTSIIGRWSDGLSYGSANVLHDRFASDGVTFARWESGRLVHLDVPFLMWVWIRGTPLARGLRALWKGWA